MRRSRAPTIQPDISLLYVGRDAKGRPTEVLAFVAAEDDDLLIVFHATPLEW